MGFCFLVHCVIFGRLDNWLLSGIKQRLIESDRKMRASEGSHRSWTLEEDTQLRAMLVAGFEVVQIASALNRTEESVKRHAARLKLGLKHVSVKQRVTPFKKPVHGK